MTGVPVDISAPYRAIGWRVCCIPAGMKGPTGSGWNTVGATFIPQGYNIGLLHALSGTCALDIDSLHAAQLWLSERGVNLDALLNAPGAVQVVSGREGRAKLLYRLPLPLPTKKITVKGKTLLEFRCASADGTSMQDVLPPSLHPDTGQPYQWRGDYTKLPMIPNELLAVWMSLLTERPAQSSRAEPPPEPDEIASALKSLSPDCDRKTWLEIGMAINSVLPDETGFALWDDWSMVSSKYRPSEMRNQWRSLRPKEGGITVATLFKHAYEAGWQRPVPKGMFGPIPMEAASRQDVEKAMHATSTVPPLDPSLWPPRLLARAAEVSSTVGCDVAVPLLASLGAVSAAADARIRLRINETWAVSPVLWTMTIGEPSDKKTPGSRPMFTPLAKLEAEDAPRYQAAMLAWTGKEARYAAQMKAHREFHEKAHEPNDAAPEVEPLPEKPEPLRLTVYDATSQKVVRLAASHPQGFLLVLDEMKSWLGKLNDKTSGEDRGCWIQGYEGGSYTMDRVGGGTIRADNFALSIYGNCQPTVFRDELKGSSTDGVMQRFLPVVVNQEANKMWKNAPPEFLSTAKDYEALIRQVHALPQFEYSMMPDAMEVFRAFCEFCLDFRRAEKNINRAVAYQTALGKMEGNCARLILLTHLATQPTCPLIDRETVERAVDLMTKYFLPMLRFTYLDVAKQRDNYGMAIFDYILQAASVQETVNMAELRRAARVENSEELPPWKLDALIRTAMDDLTVLGSVMLTQDHQRNPVWAINPELAVRFKVERERFIRSRQENIERLRANVRATGREARIWDAKGWAELKQKESAGMG